MSPLSPEEAALLRGAKPEPRPAEAEKRPKGPRLSELTETPPPEGARDGALGLVRVEAPTYAEALREIRQRFGDDVSIVHTRVIRRKGMLGVLGATGVEVYVTGRGEYEEWRRHPEAGGGRIPREASRRGEGNLGSPLPEARLPETRRPAALPTAERRAPAPRAKDNPWGIEERREAPAAERRGFDAGRVIAPETRNAPGPVAGQAVGGQAVGGQAIGGQAVGQHENAAGADTDPDDVVRALERLSKKIGNVMAENGQPVEAPQPLPKGNRPTTAAPSDGRSPAGGSDPFTSRIPGTYGPGQPRSRRELSPARDLHDPSGVPVEPRAEAPAPQRPAPGLTHPVVVAAKKILEEWGVSSPIAAELLGKLSQRSLPTLSNDRSECRELARLQLRELIRPKLPPARPIPRPSAGKRRLVSLVGPTGVGKTTTLAKLGALFRITEGVKVGFITLDTYRIGAVDQLRRYADIIQVPLEVVSPGSDLHEAIERLGDVEVILIDTAGRSQKDADRIHELRSMLEGIGELEVHLCLALSASPEAILAAAENFKVVGYSRILITKLDEAYRHGVLLDLFQRAKTPVSYVTVGQEVPDDIHNATPERLEDLLLGDK